MDSEIINSLEQVEQLLASCCLCLFNERPTIRTAANNTDTQQAAFSNGNLHLSANLAANDALKKVREILGASKRAPVAEATDEMTVDEMAKREARRCDTLYILSKQPACFEAFDDIKLIRRDLDIWVKRGDALWAYLNIYSLGRICGIRQERARRARKGKRYD